MDKTKLVIEVFKDVEDREIGNCKIANINLYKKSNKLEVGLLAIDPISNISVNKFEQYLKQKFNVEFVEINVMYESSFEPADNSTVPETRSKAVGKKETGTSDNADNPYIIGKKLDSRAIKTKVIDIDIDSRNVNVEGNVISSELMEKKRIHIY